MTKEELAKVRADLKLLSEFSDAKLEAFLTMHNFMNSENVSINNDELIDTEEKSVELKVIEVLKQIGVPFHIKGYHYLRDAIMMVSKDPNYLNKITKALYPEIAKKYDTTGTRVDRAIRTAIDIAWDRGDMDTHNAIFGYTISRESGKPKNSEAIAALAEYIKYM